MMAILRSYFPIVGVPISTLCALVSHCIVEAEAEGARARAREREREVKDGRCFKTQYSFTASLQRTGKSSAKQRSLA